MIEEVVKLPSLPSLSAERTPRQRALQAQGASGNVDEAQRREQWIRRDCSGSSPQSNRRFVSRAGRKQYLDPN